MAQRNMRGGKGYKKSKSGNVRRRSKNPDIPVDTSTGIDFYGNVTGLNGDCCLQVKLVNGEIVQAQIPGRFRKKVWFNKDDYIHVKRDGTDGKFYYDVIQKIVNQSELMNARAAFGDDSDIFNPAKIDEDDEDYDKINSSDDDNDNDDELKQNRGHLNMNDKQNTSKLKITEDKIQRKNISVDKLVRKQQQKDRDTTRRANSDDCEKPVSVLEKGEKPVSVLEKGEKPVSILVKGEKLVSILEKCENFDSSGELSEDNINIDDM